MNRSAASGDPDRLLARELGVRQLAAAVFNYTVGSGIFALPALATAQLGPAAPMAYLACAVMMALVVLCFAEAGSRVSATGGPYAYVEVALGPRVGFLAGVLLWLSNLAATAAVATLFAASVGALVGGRGGRRTEWAVVMVVLAVLALVNVRGVRPGARTIEIATAAKLVPLVGFVMVGAAFVEPAHLGWAGAPPPAAVLGAAGILVFAFAGIEGALIPSGEVRDPARTVPRAVFLALGVVTVLYLAVQVVAQGILGSALGADPVTPLATAAERVAGSPGRTVMIVGAAVSMLGFLGGAMLAVPRALFALGRDGFLGRRLAAVHPRYRTPHVAIAVYAVLAAVLALSGTFERLAVLANVSVLALYLLCAIAAGVLRGRGVRADGEPFLVAGGALVPVLAGASVLWVLWATVTRREVVAVAVVLVIALAAEALSARRRRAARDA